MTKGEGRHELKYYMNYHDYLTIRNKIKYFMKTDANANENGEYEIISLYFDDIFNSAYNEKLMGINERKKYRIRIYNFNDEPIKLEKKAKTGEITSKSVARITRVDYEKIINRDVDFLLERKLYDFVDFYDGLKRNFLRPKVLVRYTREAYFMRAGNVRITFDRNLRTGNNNIRLFDKNGPYSSPEANLMIMEVKYDDFFPSHLKNLIQSNGRLKTSSSKYVLSRKYNYIY